jgi:hypothetical protein
MIKTAIKRGLATSKVSPGISIPIDRHFGRAFSPLMKCDTPLPKGVSWVITGYRDL